MQKIGHTTNGGATWNRVIAASPRAADSIIQALQVAIDGIIITEDNRIIYVNEAVARLTGFELAELYATQSVADLVVEEDREALIRHIEQPLPEQQILEVTVERRFDRNLVVGVSAAVVPTYETRRILTLRQVYHTAGPVVVDQVRDNERMYRTLYDPLAAEVVVYSPEGGVLYASEGIRELFGWQYAGPDEPAPVPDLVADDGRELLPHEHPAAIVARSGRAVRNAIIGARAGTPEERWFKVDVFPLFDGNGQLVQVFSNYVDVSAGRESDEVVRASEARVRMAIEASGLGTWECSGPDEIRFRDRALALFGVTPDALASGFYPLDMIDETDRLTLNDAIESALNGAAQVDVVFRVALPDGSERRLRMVGSRQGERGNLLGVIMEVPPSLLGGATVLRDPLTQLPNRALLQDRLMQALLHARRDTRPVSLLMLNIDGFQGINRELGQYWGDRILQEVGPVLRRNLRDNDTVARLGGDTFAIVLIGTDTVDAQAVAGKLLRAFEAPLTIDDRQVTVRITIGLVSCPEHGTDVETLMRRADLAMNSAKGASVPLMVYGKEADEAPSSHRLRAATDELRAAIENDQLMLAFLPKVSFKDRSIASLEALVRWNHPEDGLIMPTRFLSLAEQTGMIKPLTRWVLDTALLQCRDWQRLGFKMGVAVNLGAGNLSDLRLPEQVAELVKTYHLDPGLVELEINEGMITSEPESALEVLRRLSEIGVRIAIDDFGSGNSSLAYLKQTSVDQLKIDRSFVTDMLTNQHDIAIVRSTIELAHDLDIKVAAEGVEDRATWEALARMGCDYGQGYYLSEPVPMADVERWLERSPWLLSKLDS